jgi:hypothetical protein
MQIATADTELRRRLEAAGLEPTSLDAWETWKVFKAYLQAPVDADVYDSASFQFGRFDDPEDGSALSVIFVRQFSEWGDDKDVGIRRVVIEFHYGLTGLPPGASIEIWTHDFPTLAEFASVVEGSPQFQSMLNARPKSSEVYGEEL